MKLRLDDIPKIVTYCKTRYRVDIEFLSEMGVFHRASKFVNNSDSLDHFFNECDNKTFFNNFILGILPGGPEMFRDPFMWWDIRDNIVKQMYEKQDLIRVWVPDITAGEELYSIIILFEEQGVENYKIEVSELFPNTVMNSIFKGVVKMVNHEINLSNYQRFGGKYVNIDYYCKLKREELIFNKELLSKVSFIDKNVAPNDPHFVLYSNRLINLKSSVKDERLSFITNSIGKRSYLVLGSNETILNRDIDKKYKLHNKEERIYIKK